MTKTVYLIGLVVVALVLFRVARLLVLKKKSTQQYIPLVSALELGTWTFIIFWAVNIFFSDNLYYPYLIILLAIVFTMMLVWYYLKDIMAGYLFRIRHNPIKGQLIECRELKGSIRKIGISQLTVESGSGQWYRVPYSSIINQQLSLKSMYSMAPGETVIKVHLNTIVDPGHFERCVREALALSSWCVAPKPIRIKSDPQEEHTMQISFFMLDPSFHALAKLRLTKLAEQFHKVTP